MCQCQQPGVSGPNPLCRAQAFAWLSSTWASSTMAAYAGPHGSGAGGTDVSPERESSHGRRNLGSWHPGLFSYLPDIVLPREDGQNIAQTDVFFLLSRLAKFMCARTRPSAWPRNANEVQHETSGLPAPAPSKPRSPFPAERPDSSLVLDEVPSMSASSCWCTCDLQPWLGTMPKCRGPHPADAAIFIRL